MSYKVEGWEGLKAELDKIRQILTDWQGADAQNTWGVDLTLRVEASSPRNSAILTLMCDGSTSESVEDALGGEYSLWTPEGTIFDKSTEDFQKVLTQTDSDLVIAHLRAEIKKAQNERDEAALKILDLEEALARCQNRMTC